MSIKTIVLAAVVVITFGSVMVPMINSMVTDVVTYESAYSGNADYSVLMSEAVSGSGTITEGVLTYNGVEYLDDTPERHPIIIADTIMMRTHKVGFTTNYYADGTTAFVTPGAAPGDSATFSFSDGVFRIVGIANGADVDVSIPYNWLYIIDPNGDNVGFYVSNDNGVVRTNNLDNVRAVSYRGTYYSSSIGDTVSLAGGASGGSVTINEIINDGIISLDFSSGSPILFSYGDFSSVAATMVLVPRYVEISEPSAISNYTVLLYAIPSIFIIALIAAFALIIRFRD